MSETVYRLASSLLLKGLRACGWSVQMELKAPSGERVAVALSNERCRWIKVQEVNMQWVELPSSATYRAEVHS
mgnify:FL=1